MGGNVTIGWHPPDDRNLDKNYDWARITWKEDGGASNAMTPEMIITLIVMVAATVLFDTEWIRIDLVALLVLIALVVTGVLTIDEAVAGFSSTAVLCIVSLFVFCGAIFYTTHAYT